MHRAFSITVLMLFVLGTRALAQEPDFASYWTSVSANPDCKPADYADFVLFTCEKEMTMWYFTKPNHPAHPGVIRRTISQQPDGSWAAQEEGHSFASDAAQPAFKAWLAQIADLDRQMRDSIAAQQAQVRPKQ